MILHGYHANGGCGLPGDEEYSGKKCEMVAERFVGNSSLSQGLFTGKGKMVIFRMLKHGEDDTNEQARRNKEVGFGITSIGVGSKKI